MLTWHKNTVFVNAELSTTEHGAVVGRYAEMKSSALRHADKR